MGILSVLISLIWVIFAIKSSDAWSTEGIDELGSFGFLLLPVLFFAGVLNIRKGMKNSKPNKIDSNF
jgi:hypothetical protein